MLDIRSDESVDGARERSESGNNCFHTLVMNISSMRRVVVAGVIVDNRDASSGWRQLEKYMVFESEFSISTALGSSSFDGCVSRGHAEQDRRRDPIFIWLTILSQPLRRRQQLEQLGGASLPESRVRMKSSTEIKWPSGLVFCGVLPAMVVEAALANRDVGPYI
jgi:hypothetical protein